MSLHLGILQLVSTIVFVLAAVASLAAGYKLRGSTGLLGWGIALLMMALSNFLLYRYGAVADPSGLVTVGTLFVAACATMWMSLRQAHRPGVRLGVVVGVVIASCCIFVAAFFTAWHFGSAFRAYSLVFSLFAGGLMLLAAFEARSETAGRRRLWPDNPISGALLAIAVAHFARGGVVVLEVERMLDISTSSVVINNLRYFTTVCVLLVTIGLVLSAVRQQDEMPNAP